jgi:hypothetical protein
MLSLFGQALGQLPIHPNGLERIYPRTRFNTPNPATRFNIRVPGSRPVPKVSVEDSNFCASAT